MCCVCKTEQPSTFRFTNQTLQVTDYTHSLTVAELGTAAWTDANAPCPCAFWILKRISSTISIVDGSGDAWLWLMAFAALFLHLEVSVPCNAHAHRKKMASTQNKRQPTGQLNDSTKLGAEGGGKKQKWDVEHKQTTKTILCPRFVLFLCCSVVDDDDSLLVSSPSKTGNCDNRVIVHFVLSLYFKQILDSASVSAATTTRAVLVFVFCLSPLFNCFGNCNRSWQVTARLV